MTTLWCAVAIATAAAAVLWIARRFRHGNVGIWLPSYLKGDWAGRRERRRAAAQTIHVLLCVADHFEPGLGSPGKDGERRRIARWLEEYPRLFDGFRDADGRPPRHTFFFPAEQYRPEHLDALGKLVRAGYGEVEVHLHHDRDTADGLRDKLQEFTARLGRHGHLGARRDGATRAFGFVHGNWALDNSLPDGRWCGVNNELQVLCQCGCYADFTLPSAPSAAQTRRVNSIYYATDDPDRPRSHDDGVEVRVGGRETGDLMIIQGALAVRWPGGRFGAIPRLENANLGAAMPPTPRRLRAWLRTRVCVAGRPDWVFVKLHTHCCNEANWDVLLGPAMLDFHRHLAEVCHDGARRRLHYVTAREVYNIVKAAEAGMSGDPSRYRDFAIGPPPLASG